MLKARLQPISIKRELDNEYRSQLGILRDLLRDDAEILHLIPLGEAIPEDIDAVLLPQLSGEVYDMVDELRRFSIPLVAITSEFGTMNMWDWEIISFLRNEGIRVIAPYSLDQSKVICRALATRRKLSQSKFVVYQDKPGEGGKQDSIFRRFFWWQDKCVEGLRNKFGIRVEKRSFKDLGKKARGIPDFEAMDVLRGLSINVSEDLHEEALLSAIKLYLALKRDLGEDGSVIGAGINCLNESDYSDTTPCLAWCLLFEERGLIWACEADLLSLLTMCIMHLALNAPVMMSNIYPFLMGPAAIKHERIPSFPEIVEDPENHILVAHCGYTGLIPRPFSTSWILRPKVLSIVNENAHAVDARLPIGPITLVKIDSSMSKLIVIEGVVKGCVQYPGSDCRNGMIIKVKDSHNVMKKVSSHHQILVPGHHLPEIELVAEVFNLKVEFV
jgi:hypothetical protein